MRLHRLRVQAFGPFAGTEEVDFDALSRAGLFLLHGPTGAGKTSVLDAVCFALYGEVPGVRAVGRLRSDHAAADLAPQVLCEFSVGPRRFEVTRSPAWERPKKRGAGTTREQQHVLVRELVDGRWLALTQRLDEAGHLLEDLLGMGLDQFTKLVLLPQGDFAAFLRADADVRRAMLERLFGTDRYAVVQQWLAERRRAAHAEVAAARTATDELLARAAQAAEPVLGAFERPDEVTPATRVSLLERAVSHDVEDALVRHAAAQHRREQAEAELASAQRVARHQREHADLRARREALAAGGAVCDRARARLLDAERAAALVPLAGPLRAAGVEHEQALQAVAGLDEQGVDDAVLADRVAQAREDLGRLAAVAQDGAALASMVSALAVSRAEVDRLTAAADRVRAEVQTHTTALATTRSGLQAAQGVAATLDGLGEALAVGRRVAEAARRRDDLVAASGALQQERDDARQHRDSAREQWLDLRELRLRGFAAELAGTLEDGRPCRVCGSTVHPTLAQAQAGAVSAEDEQRAQRRVEAADHALVQADGLLAAAQAELAAAAAVAHGREADEAVAEVAGLQSRWEAAAAATASTGDLLAQEQRLTALIVIAQERSSELEEALALARDGVAAAAARESATRRAVTQACGQDPTLEARRRRLLGEVAAAERLLAARYEARQTQDRLDRLARTALTAARGAGFTTVEDAVAAVLPEAEATALREAVAAHESTAAQLDAALTDPARAAAAKLPVPDLQALVVTAELARTDEDAAAARKTRGESALDSLKQISGRLSAQLADAAPILEAYHVIDDLARCADGTGGENTRKMALSAYVLAARLEQVAQAASLRLAQMSGGRYQLVHSDDTLRGRGRSGLSLHVLDQWTGRRRDTASLSGGESFYTSLALALGLADVVTAEAGGTAIETLFVDEGFGSLDEETLDEVMDALDALRSGGRAVGLVSHVADMQQRIPSRLEVVKTRTGSRLRLAPAS